MGIADTPEVRAVLAEVPRTLRALAEEKEKLASEVERYKRRELAEEIVAEMDRKGLSDPGASFMDKVASVLSSNKDLLVLKEAVSMRAADLSFARVSDANEDDSNTTFEALILGAGY